MNDFDLAELYSVETAHLKRQVRRNLSRFPEDFMFQLTTNELKILRRQIGISSWGGTRYVPFVFTEQGVAMLSSVLNSRTAIKVNIQIIRVFTRMRELLLTHKDILLKLEQLEKKLLKHDRKMDKTEMEIEMIFKIIKELLTHPVQPRKRIGFQIERRINKKAKKCF